MKQYAVKEIFWTLQGEGCHAMKPAVFVRFAGCNLWSGHDGHRERDADRSGAVCPLFCDTDFVGGNGRTAGEIVERTKSLGAGPDVFVVLTGGEPLLQVDAELLRSFQDCGIATHVETNGTRAFPEDAGADWVTCSPKVHPDRLALRRCDELKVTVPSYSPMDYADAVAADNHWVQPEDGPSLQENTAAAIAFVQSNPRWRVSVQQHKLAGLR